MSANKLIVYYFDGSTRLFDIGPDVPWKVSHNTATLVIGNKVPRVHVPLCVIKEWALECD